MLGLGAKGSGRSQQMKPGPYDRRVRTGTSPTQQIPLSPPPRAHAFSRVPELWDAKSSLPGAPIAAHG